MRVAFLGLGRMGRALSRLLAERGNQMVLWNRTASAAEELRQLLGQEQSSVNVAASPAGAVRDADVVFTMLADDAATEAVVFGAKQGDGILQHMRADAIHVAMSTISVSLSQRLTEGHKERGQFYVASPVFGRPSIAEQGKLWVVAAGAEAAVARVRPLLESVSRGLTVLSEEPWRAHALKLGGNFMIASMIETLGESFVFAEAHGIPPELFIETVNSALFQSPYYLQYSKTILHPPESPGMTVELGAKDVNLFRAAAADVHRSLPQGDFLAQQLTRALESGLRNEDWPVAQYHLAQRTQSKG
jgi:3-hydroxyisobutyrate dehydrogenase-like beta-hydroxyacid dehydrogenase